MKGLTRLLTNKYFLVYLTLYLVFFLLLNGKSGFQMNEIVAVAVFVGIIFTFIAFSLSRSALPLFEEPPVRKNEMIMIIGLILFFTLFITYYKDILIPSGANDLSIKMITGLGKVVFVVFIPIVAYRISYRFRLRDWGIKVNPKLCFSRKNAKILFVLSLVIIGFQFFASNGFKPVKEGIYSNTQLFMGIPLFFLWLVLTVGIVEEFFFRTFLQSRLSLILKSQTGGIMLSAILFGLAHAPGIYLRGAGEIANLGSNPDLLLSVAYSFLALSTAGFFLSVLWLKTKNFWLIVAIHAMMDLLPGLGTFIDVFGL